MRRIALLVLSQNDVKTVLSMTEAIEAVEHAFIDVAQKRVIIPERHQIGVGSQGADMLVMSGNIGDEERLGVKIVSLFPKNRFKGLPNTVGVMLLVDNTDGTLAAVMDGTYLTSLRTGAASAVATKVLANPDASTLGIIGAGSIAPLQAEAVMEVRPITRILVFDRHPDRRERLARELEATASLAGRKVEAFAVPSAEELCRGSDIICSCTTATIPVVRAEWLRPGAHVNGVGTFSPAMQEVDEPFVSACSVLAVDSKPAALRPGDLANPLAKGLVTEDSIFEIGEILTGSAGRRPSEDAWTYFKTVGVSAQDVLCGWKAFSKAIANGIGTEVSLFGEGSANGAKP